MKHRSKIKFLAFLTSFLFVGGATLSIVNSPLMATRAETTLPESSFKNVNYYNNNVYKETEHCYATMLEYDIGFSSTSQTKTNLATSSYDLGNKMTYNGVAVKNIPNFYAAYYDAGKDGKMLWFKVPEENINPSGAYTYSTIFIPKGMQVFDAVTKEDVTLRLINDGWNPTFGSDVTFLTKRPANIAAYGMDGGYTLKDASDEGYTGGINRVLRLDESTNGCTAATLDFYDRDIEVASIRSITFKFKFIYSDDITGTEFRITNDAGAHWLFRATVDQGAANTWYSLTIKPDKTFESDVPGISIIENNGFARLGSRLSQFMAGLRIKPSGSKMGLVFGDIIIDAAEKQTSTFLRVNSYNNNVHDETNHYYQTMLEFDTPFASENKATINLATSSFDLGNRMTLNGVAIKDIPNFFASYYFAKDVNAPMLLIRIPEANIAPSGDYENTTISIPAGTIVHDLKVKEPINLALINDKWTIPLTQCSFKEVNTYNNNNYDATNHIYTSMLQYDRPFADVNKANINLANASEDIGNKMTVNGVAIKDIPNFFASYYDAGSDGYMILIKIPENVISSNPHSTLVLPKGTVIYNGVTKNDARLCLGNGKWISEGKWTATPDPVDEYDYSFAVVGDPQIINDAKPQLFPKIYHWIAENGASKKIAHTIGLGDITNRNLPEEWARARASFDELDAAGMAHTQVRGNHDQIPEFNSFFLADENYQQGIQGYYENMTNIYRTFKAGSVDYLIITLDYGANDAALNWANGVVESHPNHNVIVVTHGYLERNGELLDKNGSIPPVGTGGYNNGDDIWNKFVKKHENISMVLSGHIYCDNVVVSQRTGDNGNTVTQILIDPQQMDKSTPTGLVAMFYFSNGGKNLQIEYFSTILELYEVTSATKKLTVHVTENEATIAEKEANDMAKEFLSSVTCDGGSTAPSVDAWNTFSFKYATLSNEAKAVFANATANENGTNVEKAVARYDYICSKYNSNGVIYKEFITGRTVIHSNSYKLSSSNSMLSMMAIISVSVALVGVTCFVFYKKRKESK